MRVSIGLAALLVAGCSGGDDTPTPDARPPAIDANMNLLSQAGLYSDFANRLPRGRTYVRNGEDRGVWFFSLDASSAIAVAAMLMMPFAPKPSLV